MANHLYLQSLWKVKAPEPFDTASTTSSEHISIYNTAKTKSTLYAPALWAILSYAAMQSNFEQGKECSNAIGYVDNELIVCEHKGKYTDCVVYNRTTKKFIVGVCEDEARLALIPYSLGENARKGTSLFFALMPVFLENEEFNDLYSEFYEQYKAGYPDMDLVHKVGYIMCDNIYRRINNASHFGVAGVGVTIPATGNLVPLRVTAIENCTYVPNSILYGEFKIMKSDKVTKKTVEIKKEDFVGKYKLSERNFTPFEKSQIPTLPDWYVVPKEVDDVCRHIKETANSNMPIKNIMLRGPAGTGKTESAKAIAAGLGLPYMFLTCSANTETFDLIGQILPDMDSKSFIDKLPKFDDIMMDPGTVYYKLTGTYKEDVSNDDVYELLMKKVMQSGSDKQNFKYVETALINAMRNGFVVELQEPAIISNPGVLVGLNGLLDKCESVALPTGEVIKRHPECIIILTTNTDYEGCKSLNQSVISRMNMVLDVEKLSRAEIVERVAKVTNFSDISLLEKMAEVLEDISKKCEETMITDGSHGVRELIAWVESVKVTNNPYESALYTIIPLATADSESRAELIDTCLSTRISA